MGVFVNFAFNASAELALANGLGGSVFLTQLQQTSASTSEALDEAVVDIPWSAASNTSVASFSATCWFSAKAVVLGRPPSAAGIPVGLVAFPFNGTPIKIHATPAANAANEHLYPGGNISVPGPDCNRNTPCGPSAAFNALIQPLLIGPVRAAAMIWFQGENDAHPEEVSPSGGASGYYSAQLAALISDWRAGFDSPGAHWTTVQLAPFLAAQPLAAFRDVQCATTWAAANASCAVIVDDGDPLSPRGSVHSRNKQLVGARVAPGILAHVYGVGAGDPSTQLGPRFSHVAATATDPLRATIALVPETLGGAPLVYVPPHASPWQNSSRCPVELSGVTLQDCGFFVLVGSDGVAYNATNVTAGGQALEVAAAGAPPSVTVAGCTFGWAVWPVVNWYNSHGLPLVPWNVTL